ncbi:MAG: DNA-directed RNA polymerase subunit alpha [Candidatus Portnoybacteria bacterium]|nr:DNA-directed RNA polymerase subunit alpha [Candidatus Portnoybacteria bacterium]
MYEIPLPKAPRIVASKDNQGTFVIEDLYPGYGVTMANALRRIALSSIPGAAVIAVKIKDVDHEFSTIPGVLEDVGEIILHIKKMRFEVYGEEVFEAHVKVKGERLVKAGDFKFPSEVKIINTELPIATLTDKKSELEMTVWITKGVGYELANEHNPKLVPQGVGTLKVDSIFTPTIAANFEVENMRVGERTDYNRIIFNVQTDGTISPQDAFERSVETLIHQFNAIAKVKPAQGSKVTSKGEGVKESNREKVVTLPEKAAKLGVEPPISPRFFIAHLKLSSRIEKILKRHRLKTIAQLLRQSEADFLKIDGIGEAAVKEIKRKLGKAGFVLGKQYEERESRS